MSTRTPGSFFDRLLSLRVRPLTLACILFVVLAFGVMMIRSVNESAADMEVRVTDLRIERDQMFKAYQKLENELKIVETDDYIISKARQLYGYMLPGEMLFVIKNPEALYGADENVQMYVVEDLP